MLIKIYAVVIVAQAIDKRRRREILVSLLLILFFLFLAMTSNVLSMNTCIDRFVSLYDLRYVVLPVDTCTAKKYAAT